MIPAYNGSEPYIFVSYAHKDSEEVYGTLEKLTSLGYRIWYDEGIKPGVEWPENIAEHLDRCALFMMFISPNSMASANCRREINFALSRSKKFLCIVLKQTEIPLGMELQLSSQQSIFRYKYSSEKAYIYKICSAAGMAQCKEHHYFETESAPVMSSGADAERSLMTASPNAEKSPAPEARRKKASGRSSKNNLNGAVLVGILIGAVIIFAFTFMLFKDSSLFKGGGNATTTVTPSLTPTLTPTPTPTVTPTSAPTVTPTSAPTVTPTPIMTQDTQAAGTTTDTTNTTNTDTTNNNTGAQDTTDDTDQTDGTTTDEDEDYTVIIEGNNVIDEEEGARAEYGDYDTYGDT